MRLWSLHPSYLDARELVALWREGLLAQAVLRGETRGYKHHPQLIRFRGHSAPVSAINDYLQAVAGEADRRGYPFDRARIGPVRYRSRLPVTDGQLTFESSTCAPSWRAAPRRTSSGCPLEQRRAQIRCSR